MSTNSDRARDRWLWDSGADIHTINDIKWYKDGEFRVTPQTHPITTGGGPVYSSHLSTAVIQVKMDAVITRVTGFVGDQSARCLKSEPQDSSRRGLTGVRGRTVKGTPTARRRQNSVDFSSPAARPQTPTPSKHSPLSRASSSGGGEFSRFMETKKGSAMSANARHEHSVVEVASSHASPSHSPPPPQHLPDPFVEPPANQHDRHCQPESAEAHSGSN
ncbi:hypothetical protein NM208_g8928 [Fusarium decemcellulare]|uniref:Uncharacterized protein n=1 Tax=Fusarium decemcellulare TaxID=57161 RepID=A0ACC1S3H5_9HYPO|nr:hypothetical protein NM208_g8928 [Fusarium decemcellulare]